MQQPIRTIWTGFISLSVRFCRIYQPYVLKRIYLPIRTFWSGFSRLSQIFIPAQAEPNPIARHIILDTIVFIHKVWLIKNFCLNFLTEYISSRICVKKREDKFVIRREMYIVYVFDTKHMELERNNFLLLYLFFLLFLSYPA